MEKQDLVRPTRDGDQFHYHWAARQCLALLPGDGDLVAVTIEGSSAVEAIDDPVEAGDELIDVGLYYGSEQLSEARLIRYIQLKHSTRNSLKAWTASGLKKTLSGFARRYLSLAERLSEDDLKQRVRFEFTTNRPIALNVLEALQDLASGAIPRYRYEQELILGYTGLDVAQAVKFFQLFWVDGDQPSLWAQKELLVADVAEYLAEADYDAPVQLKELVTRKATSEFESNPSIRRYDVLGALKVAEDDLLPAPCQIASLSETLPREQEAEIRAALLVAEHPIVIHADGGVGKSILAHRLAESMPTGSVSILYDCFGDGLYRNALHFRHRYCDALVQIANELAARGLCHPLIPSHHADGKQYMRVFCSRLRQAIGSLRAQDPEASLCLIIDAADNADMAAEERRETSFVQDLIRTSLPDGVRLAFTCRTHRRQRLAAPPEVGEIQLRSFSLVESACHLRSVHSEATDSEVEEFAFLSSSNPRVQALALDRDLSVPEILRQLGPAPTTVDRAIGDLLQKAVDQLKDRVGAIESAQIELICQGLAILRPLVPVSVLACISDTPESAVRSFALDLGRPLMLKGGSLHFLDEPAETWFREQFEPDAAGLAKFLERLRPIAKHSSYAASVLPQLLLSSGRLDELVQLALSSDGLPAENPVERRDVELQRLTFALRACLSEGRHLAAAKLALKAGGEAAGESRQTKLIQENTDIASFLFQPDRVDEIVSRRSFGSTWMGSHHAYDAGLLSGCTEFTADASSRLRMAMDWLVAWARGPREDPLRRSVSHEDRAELAMCLLRLRGPDAAAEFLRRWTNRRLAFDAAKLLARRLVDLELYELLDDLALAAKNDIWLLLGLAAEARWIDHCLPSAPLARLLRLLADRRVKLPESPGLAMELDILFGVEAAVTMALRKLPQDTKSWGDVLRRYLPESPPASLALESARDRSPILRAYALEAALRGDQLSLLELAPDIVRKELDGGNQYTQNREVRTFEAEVGGLLPWFVLGAEIACGRSPESLIENVDALATTTAASEVHAYPSRDILRQTAALECLRVLRDSSCEDLGKVVALRKWLEDPDRPLWTGTLTAMCRYAARVKGFNTLAVELASKAYGSLEGSRDDAEWRADSYVNLARAILPVSRAEATSHLNRAIEILSRIGDENLSRWSALLHLANASGELSRPRPKSAYRLSRAAELTYEYVARDKYFDWDETIGALACLCGPSTLAILSRWRDRQFGIAERLLPILINQLIEKGALPATTPIALIGLSFEWDGLGDLRRAMDSVGEVSKQRSLVQLAYRYMRVQNHDESFWEALAEIGNRLELHLPDIDRLLAASQIASASGGNKPPAERFPQEPVDRSTPDWSSFLADVDLTDSSALRSAYAELRTYDPPVQLAVFLAESLRRVEVGSTPDFVRAVAAWPDFEFYELMDLLNALPKPLPPLNSLRVSLRDAVLTACRREPERIRRRGGGNLIRFEQLEADGIVDDRSVVQATLGGFAERTDILGPEAIFQIVDPLASCLTSNEAEEALVFGLDLLEEALRPEDGDGPWHESLLPPSSCVLALSGYVWVGLGSPSAADRWEFAHVVRTCVELGWDELLSALSGAYSSRLSDPFVDRGLQFYSWHAHQWLLIGLARGALENPRALSTAVPMLQSSLLEEHVVIRALAAQTIKVLREMGVMDGDVVSDTSSINRPELPLDVYPSWRGPATDDYLTEGPAAENDDKYYFRMDIGPYWFAPLGQVFGITKVGIEKLAKLVFRERLGAVTEGREEDARYKRTIFSGHATSHSHGGLPKIDDLLAYRSYHAMMIMAARLLRERRVGKRAEEPKDEFEDWLESYTFANDDGRWLADCRDPRLASEPIPPDGYNDRAWIWCVTKDYLDQQLKTDDNLLVLWGSWSNGQTDSRETVSIRSALVSRDGAEALLVALQTAPELDRFYLPDGHRDDCFEADQLRLSSWIFDGDQSTSIDNFDPWASDLGFPGPYPNASIADELDLVRLPDGRRMEVAGDEDAFLRRELWTQIAEYGRERDAIPGTRLSGSSKFIRSLLEKHDQELLILSVSIRRTSSRSERERGGIDDYPAPYVRYYLMEKDGIARSF